MAQVTLYPPGGGAPVKAHPSQVKSMKSYGWTEKPAKKTTKQQKEES